MRVAMAVWNGRVSPVFDVAQHLAVYEVGEGAAGEPASAALTSADPAARAAEVAGLGIDALICGAVSRPLASMLLARGVEVIPFIAGDTDEVLQAFLAGQLPNPRLCMPGCGRAFAGQGSGAFDGQGRGRGRGPGCGRGRRGPGRGRLG